MRTYIVKDQQEADQLRRRKAGISTLEFGVIIDPDRIALQQEIEQSWMDNQIPSEEYYTKCAQHDMFFSEDGDHLVLIDLENLRERYHHDKDLFPESPGMREKIIAEMDITIAKKKEVASGN